MYELFKLFNIQYSSILVIVTKVVSPMLDTRIEHYSMDRRVGIIEMNIIFMSMVHILCHYELTIYMLGPSTPVSGSSLSGMHVNNVTTCKGQNPLHQFPRSKSVTSWQFPRLRGSYGETDVVDFGHYQVTPSYCASSRSSITVFRLFHNCIGHQSLQSWRQHFVGICRHTFDQRPRCCWMSVVHDCSPSAIGLSLLPLHELESSLSHLHMSRPHPLWLIFEVASRLSASSGVPSHDFYRNFCIAYTVTVVIFGHLNRSFYLHTYSLASRLPTQFWR